MARIEDRPRDGSKVYTNQKKHLLPKHDRPRKDRRVKHTRTHTVRKGEERILVSGRRSSSQFGLFARNRLLMLKIDLLFLTQ